MKNQLALYWCLYITCIFATNNTHLRSGHGSRPKEGPKHSLHFDSMTENSKTQKKQYRKINELNVKEVDNGVTPSTTAYTLLEMLLKTRKEQNLEEFMFNINVTKGL